MAGVGALGSAPGSGGGSAPDATTSTKGSVQLTGDLGGTAASPTTPRANAAVGYTGTLRGAWAASTAYAVGDVVTTESGVYRATTAATSNGVGFRYDRNYWEALPVPVLAGATTVPVRQLDLTNPGAGSEAIPLAGIFQHRPKQFDYSAERVAWYFDEAADFTTSGTAIPTVAAGTAIGGSVVITSHASSTSQGYAAAPVLGTAINLTGMHLRVPIKVSAATGRFLSLQLTSAGTDYTNRLNVNIMAGSTDNTPVGRWVMVSIPISEMTVVGTGADITAINGARIMTENGSGGQWTTEVSRIGYHPNAADKAKCVLWLDDGTFTSHRTAIKMAAAYGFPVVLAPIANNLTMSGAPITTDEARYAQDYLGAQIAVHAFGAVDHNRVQTGKTLQEQLLSYQHFGLAAGLHGVMDGAYWSTGFTGADTAALDLVARRLFRSMRGGRSRLVETLPPAEPLFTRALMTGGGNTSTGVYQPYATRAINCKGLAQFVWHDMAAGDLTEFGTFLAWLDTNRATIQVTTIAGAFDPLSR